MNTEVHLSDLVIPLRGCLIHLDHEFLKRMIFQSTPHPRPCQDRELARELEISFNDRYQRALGLYSLLKKNRFISFRFLELLRVRAGNSWDDIETYTLGIRAGRKGGEVYPRFPIKFDSALGSIAGHILGDGSIDQRYSQVFFTNQDNSLIFEFHSAMISVFNTEPRIWLQDPGRFKKQSKWIKRLNSLSEILPSQQIGLFYPSICGLILNAILGDFARGCKKRISPQILQAPNEFLIRLVRAFFDDEGHLDRVRGPRFNQDDRDILVGIKSILEKIGIFSYPIHYYIRGGKKHHFFNINHRDNYRKYLSLIGCSSPKKAIDLEQLVKKTNKTRPISISRKSQTL